MPVNSGAGRFGDAPVRPSELLSSYNIEKRSFPCVDEADDDNDQNEEVLHRVLESIGSLGAFSQTHSDKVMRACDADILGSALMHDGPIRVTDVRTSTNGSSESRGENMDEAEWDSCLTLIRLILGLPESIDRSKTRKSRVPPHVVLRMVIDHSLDLCSDYEDIDILQDERSSLDTAPITVITNKAILLALLGVGSIRIVTSEIQSMLESTTSLSSSSEDAKPKIRWRRALSMAAECIGLFQRLILSPLKRRCDSCNAAADITTLLCRYLAPSVGSILSVVQEGAKAGLCSHSIATTQTELIEAGLVSATTGAARLVNSFQPTSNGSASGIVRSRQLVSDLSLELIRLCIIPLSRLRLDTVLLHPLRRNYDQRSPLGSHEEESDLDDNVDLSVLCCRSSLNSDRTGGMETRWDSVGIAYIAYHILLTRFQENSEVSDILPYMYVVSLQYTFVLLYPHVKTILALGHNGNYDVASDHGLGYAWTGIEMLSFVLSLVESCPMLSDESNNKKRWSPFDRIVEDFEGPLGPAGNVQLLLNVAVIMSNQGGTVVAGLPQPRDQVSKSQILRLIRTLLSCYRPIQHITCIKMLLSRCPYPFLESVLLDLLRPALLVTGVARSSVLGLPVADTAEKTCRILSVEDETLNILHNYLEGMKSHTAAGEQDFSLVRMNDLVEMVEQYTCTASIIRLLYVRRQKFRLLYGEEATATSQDKRFNDAISVIADLNAGLRVFFDCCPSKEYQDDADCNSQNFFQLHLLADALGEVERVVACSADL
mmetsp:Transcript_25145/g.54890  ORF Transcript_25145/g.54890 Transcript_25145/m.54890 type:complete len:771 (+) Transcript_25145:274-2586(+)|eukprot:CAMPEP_0178486862 /NCGR_PEP_ID=MMETSP0696-20121128/9023_1 /TAXON_ID=265572 /ORGANISM="Extubocellulus spinifer, Strain CCMP396" /LENGTH=770 /DNA_ID=CAMNT_0020114533 /DNA_START=203 /DNA_END=2515 /DNA_ORIENTATION=+